MEKKALPRAPLRSSLESSLEHTPPDSAALISGVGSEQTKAPAKVSGSVQSVNSAGRRTQKASTDEEGSASSGDEDASALLRPRASVTTLEQPATGRLISPAVRQGNIDHFATLPRRGQSNQEQFSTLPRQHPPRTTHPSEEKRSKEQAALDHKALSLNIISPAVVPAQNNAPVKLMEDKSDTTITMTTTTAWPQDTKFVSLDALESFNKQLQMLAESEVDNEVDFYDKVISGLQEKIDELHDTILKVEHNCQLSVKMAEQRTLEAETKLQMTMEKAEKFEQRYLWALSRCKELEAGLQKVAILQERDRAASQRTHLPQRVQSAREIDYSSSRTQIIPTRPEHRHHPGLQGERSSPQALRSDPCPSQAEPHPNKSWSYDQSVSQGQNSERLTYQSQLIHNSDLVQSPGTERVPTQGQTRRASAQGQLTERNGGQPSPAARNPNQQGYPTVRAGAVQSQAQDRTPTHHFRHISVDKSLPIMQQTGPVVSTETTV